MTDKKLIVQIRTSMNSLSSDQIKMAQEAHSLEGIYVEWPELPVLATVVAIDNDRAVVAYHDSGYIQSISLYDIRVHSLDGLEWKY